MSTPDWSIKPTRKRFSTEKQILLEIDKCHTNSKRALEKAESIDLQIRQIMENPPKDSDADQLSQMIRDLKMEAQKWRTYATNQTTKKAMKLGVKLSQFRTELLPMGSNDRSIPRSLR